MNAPSTAADADFKRRDAESYDGVAEDFELLTGRYTAPMANRILPLAGIAGGDHVLDVGCGTGVLTLRAARAVGAGGRVVGFDLSEGMLAKAGTLAGEAGLADRVTFVRGDAEHMSFRDEVYDAVISLYALRHFPDPNTALREMLRCCKRGGRAMVAIGSAPPLFSAGTVRAGLRAVAELPLRMLGRAPLLAPGFLDRLIEKRLGAGAGPEHAAWTHGIDRFDQGLASLMRDAGFERVRCTWAGQSAVLESVDDFWTLQVTLSSRARKRLQAASRAETSALRAEFDTQCRRHLARGGRLVYRSGALVAIASRPR